MAVFKVSCVERNLIIVTCVALNLCQNKAKTTYRMSCIVHTYNHRFRITTMLIIFRSFYLISTSYFYTLKCLLNMADFTPLKGTVYFMMILIG